MNIGNTIAEYRRKAGLSQKGLASKIRTNPSFLSAIENGHRKPTFNFMERISSALELPIEIILWESIDLNEIPAADRKTVEIAKTLVKHYLQAKRPRPHGRPLSR